MTAVQISMRSGRSMHSSERCLVGKARSRPVKCNSHAFIKISVSTIILPCFLADACIYMRMWKPLQGQYPESTFCKTVRLCYRAVVLSVCLSILSVFNVGVLWPNGWMDQDETWHGFGLGPDHIVLDGDPAPPPKGGGGTAAPTFRPMYCSQTARWIKMSHGMEVGLGPGHIVLDGDPVPTPKKRGTAAPYFRPMSLLTKRLNGSRCHLVRRPRPHCAKLICRSGSP